MREVSPKFFNRGTIDVAQDLLGKAIVVGNKIGVIAETEAYCGECDLACHARFGRTKRSEILYRQPGTIYVYLCYGVHWMFNIVTEDNDKPGAVLIRGVIIDNFSPARGEIKRGGRIIGQAPTTPSPSSGRRGTNVVFGPGRVTKYFGITGADNGRMIGERIKLIDGIKITSKSIKKSPRVGISFAPEPWRSKKWRFSLINSEQANR